MESESQKKIIITSGFRTRANYWSKAIRAGLFERR